VSFADTSGFPDVYVSTETAPVYYRNEYSGNDVIVHMVYNGNVGDIYLVVNSTAATDYTISGNVMTTFDEVENNDDTASATPLPPFEFYWYAGSVGTGGYDGDSIDYLTFTANVGDYPGFDCYFDDASGTVQTSLYDNDGDLLATSTVFGGDAYLDHEIVAGDTSPFFLKVEATSGASGYSVAGYNFF
jgi:hypothetical protein